MLRFGFARSTTPSRRPFALFERWIGALLDPQRQERTVLVTLAVYTAIWTAYRTVSTWPRAMWRSIAVSRRCAISPSRMAPARRAPPLKVCRARIAATPAFI